MATEARTVSESAFRQFRLGQSSTGPADQWMAAELWASRSISRSIPDGAAVVLALDGSFSLDCTALVVCEMGDVPHLYVVGLWGNPSQFDESHRALVLYARTRSETRAARGASLEVTADPFRWQSSLQLVADERIPVSEYPQSPARMTPPLRTPTRPP